MKRGTPVVIDSDDDLAISDSSPSLKNEPVKPQVNRSTFFSTAGSSPWLSKDRNLTTTSRSDVVKSSVNHSVTPSKSSSSYSSQSSDDGEFDTKVLKLVDMFPDMPRNKIEETLRNCSQSEERALDTIINIRCAEAASERKRKYSIFQSSPSPSSSFSSSGPAPAKRARPLPSESDSSQEVHPLSSPVSANPQKPASSPDPKVFAERLKFLSEAFPSISKQELESVLRESKMDVELAAVSLSACHPHAQLAKHVSRTENVGSIKAFQASRVLARVNEVVSDQLSNKQTAVKKGSRIRLVDDDDDDDDDDEYGKSKPSGNSREGTESSVSWNDSVLDFFNTATVDELSCVDGCSKKKSQLIVDRRPFTDWSDLTSKFDGAGKALPGYLIAECKELLRVRNNVRTLMDVVRTSPSRWRTSSRS